MDMSICREPELAVLVLKHLELREIRKLLGGSSSGESKDGLSA